MLPIYYNAPEGAGEGAEPSSLPVASPVSTPAPSLPDDPIARAVAAWEASEDPEAPAAPAAPAEPAAPPASPPPAAAESASDRWARLAELDHAARTARQEANELRERLAALEGAPAPDLRQLIAQDPEAALTLALEAYGQSGGEEGAEAVAAAAPAAAAKAESELAERIAKLEAQLAESAERERSSAQRSAREAFHGRVAEAITTTEGGEERWDLVRMEGPRGAYDLVAEVQTAYQKRTGQPMPLSSALDAVEDHLQAEIKPELERYRASKKLGALFGQAQPPATPQPKPSSTTSAAPPMGSSGAEARTGEPSEEERIQRAIAAWSAAEEEETKNRR